jgi:hypothetical protein
MVNNVNNNIVSDEPVNKFQVCDAAQFMLAWLIEAPCLKRRKKRLLLVQNYQWLMCSAPVAPMLLLRAKLCFDPYNLPLRLMYFELYMN